MKKPLFVLLFLLIIGLLFVGCTEKEKEGAPEQQSSIPVQTEEKEDKDESLPDGSQWSIKAYLKELPNVFSETWSPDNKKVAYMVFDQFKETGKIFIWQVGEKEPKIVQSIEDRINELYWSPDSQYIIADMGTSALRLGEIVDAVKCTKVDSINYVGKPVWSPDGKWVALGKVRSIEPPIEWELDGTVDLVMYNIASKEIKVIKKGNHDKYYRPLNWQEDRVLEYVYIQMDGNSKRRWYLSREGPFKDEFEERVIKKYTSPSKKNEIILVKNNRGYNVYCQNENYFAQVKQFSFLGDLPTISWSPQEKYLLLGIGGSEISSGYIFDIINGNGMGQVDYLTGPFWSPNSEYFSFTRWGDEIPNVPDVAEAGPFFTTDLFIYDLELTNYFTNVLEGTADFYYTAEGWGQDGVQYSKRAINTGEVLEKGKYLYARNIISCNPETGEKKVLESFAGRKYGNFNYSPDKKWISLIRHHPSFGDAYPGSPAFYNTVTEEIKELDKVFQALGGWEETSWFNQAPRVIIKHSEILDVNSWEITKIKVGENERILGSKPGPDDNKIAVFTYKNEENNHDDLGISLNLYIMDDNGKEVLKKYNTNLLPYFHSNSQSLLPVDFAWLDNNTLVLESWREQYKGIVDIYKLDINSGQTKKLIENAHIPRPTPDGSKLAVIEFKDGSRYFPQDIKVVNTEGDIITTLNCKDFGLDFFGSDMVWSNDSSRLVIKGYKEENKVRKQYVVIYNLEAENGKVTEFGNNELNSPGKQFLYVSEDGTEVVYSQMGRIE